MTIGIAISRATSLDVTWTTVHLALAALRRGVPVRFIEPWDYEVDERGLMTARAYAFDPPAPDAEAIVDALRGQRAKRRYVRIDTLDVLLLRASPLDPGLLGFASAAEDLEVTVANSPRGLIRAAHKGWLASLRDVPTPPTLVTQSRGAAHLFLDRMGTALVVKPAQGSGGRHVTLVPKGDGEGLDRAFTLARGRNTHVVLQTYLTEAAAGEKRLVWMDGHVLGGYSRRRAPGEFRHNLKQGGTPEATTITAAEHALVAPLSAHLVKSGIRLAGIDLIGQHVIEVNAVNPGGSFHADRLHGTDITGTIVETLLSNKRPSESRSVQWAHPAP
jgi:glutathione synthase